ncbi:MAG: type IV secretory system conjugative DNA transfer family protein [Gammaproteobacteria bacterium]|nr:MAG: type IV secretory system conjugative DNA transfer family protein [Gammaproteobacteria bacterium]
MSFSELYALYILYAIGFLTNEEAISILISYVGFCLVALFATRTVLILFSRKIGIYHPDYYRLWPRLPWRSLMIIWNDIRIWIERTFQMGNRATGGFSNALNTLTLLYKPGHILLGRAFAWGFGLLQPVGIEVVRHIFMYAMTAAGKTTALITILSTWCNSVFVIDPKAQITNALFEHDWRTWYVLDPYGISNATSSACFNTIDCIKTAMERDGDQAAVLWAMRIAQALVITPSGSRTPYFSDTARGFLVGVILHVISYHPDEEHNLPYIRSLQVNGYRVFDPKTGKEETTPGEAQQLLLRAMLNNPAFDGAIAGAAAALANASGETGGNIRSTLLEQTKWLDIPAVRDVLRSTSLPLSDLKTRNDVVFSLTAPVLSIREELAPLCRLLTNMTAYTFEYIREKNGQCLTIVDELPSQGYNETFEVMLAVARSYGQTVLGISQNIELMKKVYPKSWATFSGEADAVFWMATNHNDTADYLAQTLGRKSHVTTDPYSGRKNYREVAVMDADQIKRFLSPDSGNLIVTRAGMRALKLKNEPYFKALPVWKYAADPDHKEIFWRKITRKAFDRKHRSID